MVKLHINGYGNRFWIDTELSIKFNGNFAEDYFHRMNGPAFISNNSNCKYWYYNNNYIDCRNQKQFERLIKLLVFK